MRIAQKNKAATKFVAVVLCMLTLSSMLGAAVEKQPATVIVSYDGFERTYETYSSTVGDFLTNENIILKDSDYISHTDKAPVTDGMRMVIKIAKYITVENGGNTYGGITYATNVEAALKNFSIPLNDGDTVYPPKNARAYDGMVVTIKRAALVTFTRDGSTIKRYTQAATVGDFLKEIGVRPSSYQSITPRIDAYITDGMHITFKDVETMSDLDFAADLLDAKVIRCTATAYTSSPDETWPYSDGKTATGALCQVGVVAVDPDVIPLKSKLYIETADGSFIYGYCVAEDTGGAIKGNRVDLVMNTKEECYNFGRRDVNVYILS